MASLPAALLVASLVVVAAVSPVQGIRYPLQASATFAPSNDDASTVANTGAFLHSGKGSPTGKSVARAAQAAAVDRLNTPTAKSPATLTPSNDDASNVSDAISQLSSNTGTPSQDAHARAKLSSAIAALISSPSPPASPPGGKAAQRSGKAAAAASAGKAYSSPPAKLFTPAAKRAAQVPATSAPSSGSPFTPTNDDSSTIENATNYLQSGTGSTAGKAEATSALGKAIQDQGANAGNDEGSGLAAGSGAGNGSLTPQQEADLLSQSTGLINALSAAQSG